ncbi:hypothetical protein HanPSC8_Chr12g0508551 [Helianthus annuus]|nr:hypothetical protein HanPSC8_Chr12g0508551 [Helianthus annuus]
MYTKDPNNWKACTFHPKCINNSPLINAGLHVVLNSSLWLTLTWTSALVDQN